MMMMRVGDDKPDDRHRLDLRRYRITIKLITHIPV